MKVSYPIRRGRYYVRNEVGYVLGIMDFVRWACIHADCRPCPSAHNIVAMASPHRVPPLIIASP